MTTAVKVIVEANETGALLANEIKRRLADLPVRLSVVAHYRTRRTTGDDE